MPQNYPENLNRSAYPSITGRSGNIDMRKLNPVLAQRGEILKAYRERLVGDIKARGQISDLNSRFTRILQDLGNSSISRQEQLLAARQANHQRMTELYGNYFQQFGNVLNKEALDFLDQHSKIDAPTLTAIMAGYEHARASRAEQQLAVLDRQAKMAEAQFALEKQAADLQTQREANNALLQQQNLQNQIDTINAINKSQNQYLTDVANVYGGRGAAGRGRGAGTGVGVGVGSGSAAGSFQAPVTGATGAAGAAGVFDPNELRAVQEQIANAQAAQATGQEGQQVRRDNERNLGRAAVATASALSLPMYPFSRNSLLQTMGGALERAGSTVARGYFDAERLNRAHSANVDAQIRVQNANRISGYDRLRNAQAAYRQYLTNVDPTLTGRMREDAIRNIRNAIRNGSTAADLGISNREYNLIRNINRAEDLYAARRTVGRSAGGQRIQLTGSEIRQAALDNLRSRGNTVRELLREQQTANNVGRFSRSRLIGNAQRFGGKLLGKVLGPASLILEGANWVDELGGGIVAAGKWGIDKVFGIGDGRTFGQYYNEGRNSILAAENQLFNFISGGRVNSFLEDAGVEQVVGRLRELGWGGQGSNWDENNFTINQIMQMKDQDEDSFYKAAEALYQYDPHLDPTTGRVGEEINISPLEFFNRAYSNSVYNRQAIIQQNKAAQNLQIADQQAAAQAAEQEEIASMIGSDVHPFLRAMMGHYTEMGRPAGYDFHDGHAVAFARNYMQFVADMESGNKQGAVGAMTSTGTAKSRYQFMDKTFQSNVQWMLDEDEKAGNELLRSDERDALRRARDKDANYLDNDGYGHLLGFMTLLYPLKSSVSASKFGSGNPDITGQQMVVDMIQQFKDGGGMSPYLLSNMGAAYSGALHGRMGKKEYAKNQDRITALIQSKYGPDHIADGVFRSNMQIAELLGAQGVQWSPKYDPTIWRDNWVKENFEKNEKGDDLVPKSTYKPYEQWKIDNGLNQARQVGKPEQITMSQYIKRLNDKVDFDNLDPLVKKQLNAMAEEVGRYGRSVQLNSGRRDLVKNDELIRRWESGDRQGMVHKPSKNSKHLTGKAFDMQRSGPNGLDEIINNTPELKEKYGDARGMMAAYGFDNNVKDDPVHFSLNEDFRKKNSQSSGWTLPPVATLPFMPVEYPEVIAEPANQGIVDPLDMSQFDTLVSDALQPANVSYTPDYDIAMQQMNEYDQQQEQQGTIVGYDENGNPIYE